MVIFQWKILLPELDDRRASLWEGVLIVLIVLFSHPLFKVDTDGTILTLGVNTLLSVIWSFFGMFFPWVVPSFTEGICFKKKKKTETKKPTHHHCEKLRVSLCSICNEILTTQVGNILSLYPIVDICSSELQEQSPEWPSAMQIY